MPEMTLQMQCSIRRSDKVLSGRTTCGQCRVIDASCPGGEFRLQSYRAARYRTPFSSQLRAECASVPMIMQVISVVGALMVLIAYGLIQAGTWRELDAGYLALNIIGSLLLGIVAIEDRRVGFVLLEFAWAGIALVGVARSIRARRVARGL